MAATLTDSGELTYVSFGIEKVESTPDGDLMVYGRATDGSVDHDQQIVDPGFSSKAISEWLTTGGNVRVQHNPQRDPAGIGVEAKSDDNGATWVKSLIVEPIAKKLVSKGVLRAYSVGIANPMIERDVTGKARGGIIKSGKIVEISLVDRPANASCGFQLMKSADDGSAEYVGKVMGSDDDIQKALSADSTKDVVPEANGHVDSVDVTAFDPMSINFTPNDLMKIMQDKIVRNHYDDLAVKAIIEDEKAILGKDHREFSAEQRRQHAQAGNALPDGSYPVPDKDALRRAAILARSKHGNWQAASSLIARRAHELGVSNPMEQGGDSAKIVEPDVVTAEVKTDVSDVVKDPDGNKSGKPSGIITGDASGGDGDSTPGDNVPPKPKKKTPPKSKSKAARPKKKKLPPWVGGGNDGDDDGDADDDASKSEKCHTDPKTASGAEEPHDMNPAPVGDLKESPAKPHMKSLTEAAVMRFKTIGIDTDLGMLHDLSCPAFHPEEVVKYFPFADFSSLVDEELWQRKALTAATGRSLSEAMEAQQAWQAAVLLKNADPGMINDFRVDAYKAFRDANPGPTSFPSPGAMSPAKYNRPCLTGGHAKNPSGYDGPNSTARIPTSAPNAHSFGRPPLTSAHQSPSPSHMKSSFEYPAEQGVPTRIQYAEVEKEKARRALSMLHDHLIHMFPSTCPMLDQDAYRVEEAPAHSPVPVGKSAEADQATEVLGDVYKYIGKLEKQVRAGVLTEKQAREKLSKKTARRYAESLQRQVKEGLTSRDEVLKALGLPVPATAENAVILPPASKVPQTPETPDPVLKSEFTPSIMKTMMSEILQPFEERIDAQNARIEGLINENTEYRQKLESQEAEIAQHQKRWDALANQADPVFAGFSGLAVHPAQKSGPAGILKAAEKSEQQIQGMMMRQLERTWRTSDNPAEREAAYAALCKYKTMD